MKRCPKCRRGYTDDTLSFCLDDGTPLVDGPATDDLTTEILKYIVLPSEAPTIHQISSTDLTVILPLADSRTRNANSIAVLPFANMSSDADNEYFCDGLAEELLNALAKIDDLKVAARTSAFSFKGKNINVAEIGSALGVETILEGSVRKSGEMLRINTQLVNAAKGYQIWSERYDREMRDVFELQDEIALAVVDALKAKLLGEQKVEIQHRHSPDPAAYNLYLRGRFFLNKFTTADAFKSVELFNEAISLDPGLAAAHAGLADAFIMLTEMGPMPSHEAMPKAKEAALKAVSLDETLAEAHSSLGMILQDYEYDFTAAETAFCRAIELSPNNPIPRQSYGILLTELERHDEAAVQFQKLLEVDPLSVVGNWIHSFCLFLARQYDESLESAKATLELDPNFGVAYLSVAFAYQLKGEYESSVEAYARCSEVMGFPENAAYVRNSFNDGWENFLRSMTSPERPVTFSSYIIAVFHATLGDKDGAFAELEASFEKRESHIVMVKSDPRFDILRDDPRFAELLRKVGFPE